VVNSQSAFNLVSYAYDSIAICHLRSQHYIVSQLAYHNTLKPDAFDNSTYGISGIANKLMRLYLENRYQGISMKDSKPNKLSSKWVHVKHGVPQGSVMGPLLFLVYINYLSLSISKLANPILFADDMSIIISNTNPEEFKNNINSVMKEITNWFQSNLLTLNCEKTRFMQFLTKKQNERKIQIIAQFNKD